MHPRPSRRSRSLLIGGAFAATAALAGCLQPGPASSTNTAPVLTRIAPCRLLDTRTVPVAGTRTTPTGNIHTADVWGGSGTCDIPSTATDVVTVVTVGAGAPDGFVTMWPPDQPRPAAPNVRWTADQLTTRSQVVANLSAAGQLSFFSRSGTAYAIVDIIGYFSGDSSERRRDDAEQAPAIGPAPQSFPFASSSAMPGVATARS